MLDRREAQEYEGAGGGAWRRRSQAADGEREGAVKSRVVWGGRRAARVLGRSVRPWLPPASCHLLAATWPLSLTLSP